ncbi:MAG: hypothetical protein MJ221_04345 [Bacilli bacterium]|nr:hypothetical protein [Bacilli bacterium]
MKYISHNSGPYKTSKVLLLMRTLKQCDLLYEFKKQYDALRIKYHGYPAPITKFMDTYTSIGIIEWFSNRLGVDYALQKKLKNMYDEICKNKS